MSTVAHVDHMELSDRIEERLSRGELTPGQVDEFRDFLAEVDRDVFRHRVVTSNPYTRWFGRGEATVVPAISPRTSWGAPGSAATTGE